MATIVELPGGGRPNPGYRYGYAKGMSGWDVYAVQRALNSHQKTFPIVEDGVFGPQTHECVLREQRNHGLLVDGVLGPASQAAICATEAKLAEVKHGIPVGLLRGLALGESGLIFAAVSGPNWNGSYDAGAIQENILVSELGSKAAWDRAFDLRWGFNDTGAKLRRQYDAYYGRPGCKTAKATWLTALTYHNWPAAAEKMAEGTFDTWRYVAVDANGNKRTYGVDDYTYWVVQASAGRLTTGRQWRDAYIQSKILFVKSWD